MWHCLHNSCGCKQMNGQVIYGRCSCIAGKSACNHTAALMFAIDDMNRERSNHGSGGPPSCTSLLKRWGVPAKSTRGTEPMPVKKLQVVKPRYGKLPQQSPMDNIEPIDPSQSLVDIGRLMTLREGLVKNYQHKILFSQAWPVNPDPAQIKHLMQN